MIRRTPAPPAARRGVSGTAIASLLFALLAAGIVYRYYPDDERDVRRHLVHLAEALSLTGAENEVARMTRVAVLREYFAPDVRVIADGHEIVSRDAVVGLLSGWPAPAGGFSVDYAGETIELSEDRSTARIGLTARVVSKDITTGESVVDAREMALTMAKVQGDWVITTAETLDRP
ncbi:MAG: hypothetical protein GEU82_12710 [Luteitalea sp.]|nr:hypothetical protein [Luteitalea sp.]